MSRAHTVCRFIFVQRRSAKVKFVRYPVAGFTSKFVSLKRCCGFHTVAC
jgi:hypothetical protein